VVGKIMVTTQGAMGMLNDPTHSAVEVNDARMARLHMPTKLVDHFELVRMMKKQIHAVCWRGAKISVRRRSCAADSPA
jgi:fructose-specific phosphotransferase system component IIB